MTPLRRVAVVAEFRARRRARRRRDRTPRARRGPAAPCRRRPPARGSPPRRAAGSCAPPTAASAAPRGTRRRAHADRSRRRARSSNASSVPSRPAWRCHGYIPRSHWSRYIASAQPSPSLPISRSPPTRTSVEEHLAELVASRHRPDGVHVDAGGVVVDQHHRQTAVSRLGRARAQQHDAALRHRGLRGPDLAAVDDPVVAVAHRLRAQRREIAPGVRLREALAPAFLTAEQIAQMRARRGRGAWTLNMGTSVSTREVRLRDRHPPAPELVVHRGAVTGVAAQAAERPRANRAAPTRRRTAPPAARAGAATMSASSSEKHWRWRVSSSSSPSSHSPNPARKASSSSRGPVTRGVSPILDNFVNLRKGRAVGALRHVDSCFGCSTSNPSALGIVLSSTPDGAEGRVRFGAETEGAPGLVHGGLLADLRRRGDGLRATRGKRGAAYRRDDHPLQAADAGRHRPVLPRPGGRHDRVGACTSTRSSPRPATRPPRSPRLTPRTCCSFRRHRRAPFVNDEIAAHLHRRVPRRIADGCGAPVGLGRDHR